MDVQGPSRLDARRLELLSAMKNLLSIRDCAARLGAFRLVYAMDAPLGAILEEISGPEVILDDEDPDEEPGGADVKAQAALLAYT